MNNFYVDPLINHGMKFRSKTVPSCHLFTDGSLEELIIFAESIGLKKNWLHKTSLNHFDLVESKRIEAIKKGAIELNRSEASKKIKELRNLNKKEV